MNVKETEEAKLMLSLMSSTERRASFALSLIYAFRLLGLFMVLPVFSVYAEGLKFSTPFLIGFAVGIYGLTQVLLQIPFGLLSDKWGRKPIIIVGLLLFSLGSLIAGFSHTIYGVMLGRALQGAGAVSSAIMALVGDVTTEENRSRAMAVIGMTIGLSFAVSIFLGPLLSAMIGVAGIFFLTSLLGVSGIFLLNLVPVKKKSIFHHDSEARLSALPKLLFNKTLASLNFGIFIQHAILTGTFIAIPLMFKNMGVMLSHEAMMAFFVIILAFAVSVILIVMAEIKRKIKFVFILSILLLMASELGCWFLQHQIWGLVFFLWLFFTAFCVLEALLPSLISKIAPAGLRGSAMGLYATSQFLGIFVGGLMSGFVGEHGSIAAVLWMNAILLGMWLLVAFKMQPIPYLSSCVFPLSSHHLTREHCLTITGVVDAAVCLDEKVVYLKIDKDICDVDALQSRLNLFK